MMRATPPHRRGMPPATYKNHTFNFFYCTFSNCKERFNTANAAPNFTPTKLILIRGILSIFSHEEVDWSQQKSFQIVFPSSDFYQVLKVVQFFCLCTNSQCVKIIKNVSFEFSRQNCFYLILILTFGAKIQSC